MNATITIDKAGRLVVPKAVRDALHLKPGDELEMKQEGDSLTLRHKPVTARAKKKKGIWVFETPGPITNEMVNETLRQVRREREMRAVGE